MKIQKTKPTTVIKLETEKVICNKCGRTISTPLQEACVGMGPDYLEIEKAWGYSSEYDLQIHSFDLCQFCYAKFIKSFKYKIQKREYLP